MNITTTTKRIIDRLGLTGQHWAYAAVEAELINATARGSNWSDEEREMLARRRAVEIQFQPDATPEFDDGTDGER